MTEAATVLVYRNTKKAFHSQFLVLARQGELKVPIILHYKVKPT
jgi:hypothetical protein